MSHAYRIHANHQRLALLFVLSAVIVASLLPIAATPASAQTQPARVARDFGPVFYTATPGQANDVNVFVDSNGELGFSDSAGLVAGAGCRQAGTNFVLCGTGVQDTVMTMNDRDDEVVVEDGLRLSIQGGTGNDTVKPFRMSDTSRIAFRGEDGNDRMDYTNSDRGVTVTLIDGVANDGRPGDGDNIGGDVETVIGSGLPDRISGTEGVDFIDGGNGPDTLNGLGSDDRFIQRAFADGADVVAGGAGLDTIDYGARLGAVSLSLDGVANDGAPSPAEADNVGGDVENAVTGNGADTVTGNGLANVFVTNGGNDQLTGKGGNDGLDGRAGVDSYQGNAGNDRLIALDGASETVNCGAGVADVAQIDRGLVVDVVSGCESILGGTV